MKKILIAFLLTLAIALIAAGILWVQPTAGATPTEEPTESAQITVDPDAEVSFYWEDVAGSTRPEPVSPQQWINNTLAEAGVSPTVPVRIIQGTGICNGTEAWGCTTHMLNSKTKARMHTVDIWISSDVIGTPLGKYVLLHEVGHDYGDMSECGADAFAIRHGASTDFQRC